MNSTLHCIHCHWYFFWCSSLVSLSLLVHLLLCMRQCHCAHYISCADYLHINWDGLYIQSEFTEVHTRWNSGRVLVREWAGLPSVQLEFYSTMDFLHCSFNFFIPLLIRASLLAVIKLSCFPCTILLQKCYLPTMAKVQCLKYEKFNTAHHNVSPETEVARSRTLATYSGV